MKRLFAMMFSVAMLISVALFVSCGDEGSQESGGGGDNYYTGGGNGGSSSGTGSDASSNNASSSENNSESGNSGTTTLSAPTGLTATATSSSSIKLTWNSVSGATEYQVYYSEYLYSSSASLLNTTILTSTTATGLKANTKYYFWIKATNGTTKSVYSVCAYATTKTTSSSGSSSTTTTTLSAPTGVTAIAASSSTVELSWNSVSGATSYYVYVSEYSSSSTASSVGRTTSTSTTVKGLKANTKYYFWVQAANSTTTSGYSVYDYATTETAAASWTPPTTYQELTLGAGNAIKGNVSAGNVYWFRLYAPQSSSSQYTYTICFLDKDGDSSLYSSDVVATYYNQTGTIYASNVDNGLWGKSCSYLLSQYLYVKVECKQSGSFAIYAEGKKR